MVGTGFFDYVHEVKDAWTIAAFAIAALLSAYNIAAKKPGARRNLWIVVIGLCVLAIVPMLASLVGNPPLTIYRVHVLVLNPAGVPVAGAMVKATTLNATATGADGSCDITIPKGTLQQSGDITIFADLATPGQPRLHGAKDLTLAADPNPSLTITMAKLPGAAVTGMVEDARGRAVVGALVVIPGVEPVTSGKGGSFHLQSNASSGEEVELHAEKDGCTVTQRHPVDAGPVTLTLQCGQKTRLRK